MVVGYGDQDLGDFSRGDAIILLRRPQGTESYRFDPNPAHPTCDADPVDDATILEFLADDHNPKYWGWQGGLSHGVALYRFPQATCDPCFYRYAMLVHVADAAGTLAGQKSSDDKFFFAWALSRDGVTWGFEPEGSSLACGASSCATLPTDPRLARKIIRKATFGRLDPATLRYETPFWHPAGFFSDPTLLGQPGDNRYYLFFGYQQGLSIEVISLRFAFDENQPSGRGAVQIFDNGGTLHDPSDDAYLAAPGPCADGDSNPFRTCLPDNFDIARHQVVPDAGDAFDLTPIFKADGFFDSLLFAYDPEFRFSRGRPAFRKSMKSQFDGSPGGNGFDWGQERDLEICPFSPTYTNCGAGGAGWPVGFWQPPEESPYTGFYCGNLPCRLFGYFGAAKSSSPCIDASCFDSPQGLLLAELKLGSEPLLPEPQNLRLRQTSATEVRFDWNSAVGVPPYSTGTHTIAAGSLTSLNDAILPVYDHERRACEIPILSFCDSTGAGVGDEYFLVVSVCAAGSEGPYGFDSNLNRRPPCLTQLPGHSCSIGGGVCP